MFNYAIDKTLKKEIKEIYNYINKNPLLFNKDSIKYLSDIIGGKQQLFCNTYTLKSIISITLSCDKHMVDTDYLSVAKKLYELNVSAIETNDEINNFLNIYKLILGIDCYNLISDQYKKNCLIDNINFIYNSFENKNLVRIIFHEIDLLLISKKDRPEIFSYLKKYISQSRMYYSDELLYVSSINNFLNKIAYCINDAIILGCIIEEQLSFDKRLAGVYDIDEKKIKELEEKIFELADKLGSIEKDAEKNSNNYAKIESKSKEILSDIEKYKTVKTGNRYKIVNNEELERKNLLYKIRMRNTNFNLKTSDTRWLCKEVIDKLGIKYIANSSHSQQESIDIAYKNNQLETLCQILKLNPDFILLSPILLTKEIVESFDFHLIANVFIRDVQTFVVNLFNIGEITALKEILKINPNYNLLDTYINQYIINKKVIEQFSVEYVANCSNESKHTIFYFSMANELSKLVDIFKIEPNFYINETVDNKSICYYSNIICPLIQNFDIKEIIDFFDVEGKNLHNFINVYEKIRWYKVKTQKNDNSINEFINVSPEDRKKVLNINTNIFNDGMVDMLFEQIVKINATKLKFKKLIKK